MRSQHHIIAIQKHRQRNLADNPLTTTNPATNAVFDAPVAYVPGRGQQDFRSLLIHTLPGEMPASACGRRKAKRSRWQQMPRPSA